MQVLKLKTLLKNPEKTAGIAKDLSEGRLIIYPTETLYGIGCDPFAPNHPLDKVYEIKQRPKEKPLIFLIPDILFLEEQEVPISLVARSLMEHFWPGPLTLIIPIPEKSPLTQIAWKHTLAVRVSPHPFVRALFEHRRFLLASTSANLSGAPENQARDPEEIREIFANRVDLLITEGYKTSATPSTLLNITGTTPRIVRKGTISRSDLFTVIETGKETI